MSDTGVLIEENTAFKQPKHQIVKELLEKNLEKTKRRDPSLSPQQVEITSRDRTADQMWAIRAKRRAEEAKQLAEIDPVTGYLNRFGFEKILNQAAIRAKRSNKPLTLAYFDINGLRKVNNEKGHEAGDELLKDTAKILSDNGRLTDFIARFGGDEFAVLLPNTNEEETMVYWDRIKVKLEEAGITLSGGFIKVDPATSQTIAESKRLCDIAQTEAKKESRNENGVAMSIMVNATDLPNQKILGYK